MGDQRIHEHIWEGVSLANRVVLDAFEDLGKFDRNGQPKHQNTVMEQLTLFNP